MRALWRKAICSSKRTENTVASWRGVLVDATSAKISLVGPLYGVFLLATVLAQQRGAPLAMIITDFDYHGNQMCVLEEGMDPHKISSSKLDAEILSDFQNAPRRCFQVQGL